MHGAITERPGCASVTEDTDVVSDCRGITSTATHRDDAQATYRDVGS